MSRIGGPLRDALAPVLRSYVGASTDAPVVAFTFDDGPDPAYTPRVLDLLRSRGARATFFLLGDAVRAHPELVRRLVSEGHEVALHSDTHRSMLDLGRGARLKALAGGRRTIARASGRTPKYFRAPYGHQTGDTVLFARSLGMRPVMWSAYAREWEPDLTVGECVAHAASAMDRGAIVLLHDGAAGYDGRPARAPDEVVELVEALLDVAAERALRVVTVGELLAAGEARAAMWFRSWVIDAQPA